MLESPLLSPVAPVLTDGALGADAAALADVRTRVLLDELLELTLAMGASDLHLSAGAPPSVRIHGDIEPLAGHEPLHPDSIQRAIFAVLTTQQRAIQARSTLAAVRRLRLDNRVSLHLALGGDFRLR